MKKIFILLASFLLLIPIDMNGANDIKDILGGVLNNALSTSNLTVSDMQGSWIYQEPAVEFKSSNLLQKAGGAAASTTIVSKIKPYYEKAGINKLKFSSDSIGNFTFSNGKISATGTITPADDSGVFIFNFKAAGKINIGKITTYVSKSVSGTLTITFDASKLITVINAIAKVSNNSTVQSAASVLNSYDGLTVGFVLKKE